ncbi:MAG: signal transduction histidine kinase [Myxococcota bacterium]
MDCRDTGDVIQLEVSDNGCGIPAEELATIFDKFHQVGETDTRSFDGSGLGLYIVRDLVERHRGTIQVKSVLGEGTVFTASFPKGWTPAIAEPGTHADAALSPPSGCPIAHGG